MSDLFDSIEAFEREAQKKLVELGAKLPIEGVIASVRHRTFARDAPGYYYTEWGGMPNNPEYFLSLTRNNLSFWRGKPQHGGVLIRDYQGAQVIAFHEEVEREPQRFGLHSI